MPEGAVVDVVELELVVVVLGVGSVVDDATLVVVIVVDAVVVVLELVAAGADEVVEVDEVVVVDSPVLTAHVTPATLLKLASEASITMQR